MDTQPAQSLGRRALRWVRVVFTPLSLAIIAVFIWQSRAAVQDVLASGTWTVLLLAALLWFGANLFAPLITVCLFKACGARVDYATALRIHCRRLPAKYLPGGIWHSVGRGGDYLQLGYGARPVMLYFILENALLVLVTLGAGAFLVGDLVFDDRLRTLVNLAAIGAGITLLALPYALRYVRKIEAPLALAPYALSVLLLAIYWGVAGFTFANFLSAFPAIENAKSITETAGVYVFSWSLGYLAIFAPQGIGVSEVIAGNLLTGGNLAGQMLTLLLGFRLLVLVSDLACWLLLGLRKTGTGIS